MTPAPDVLDEPRVAAYLDRIGVAPPLTPDASQLARLQLRHLLTVPFENLTVHLPQERVVLDERALVDKIVTRRRGGFCYELNGAFAALLRSLGYEVTLLAARVHGQGGLGPPFDHAALRVDLDEPWLVDVGFGSFTHQPLRLDVRTEQSDPAGSFVLRQTPEGDLDVLHDGSPQYLLEMRPRMLRDCEATCWWHQTSPESHFTKSLVCSLLTQDGRVTLSDRTLITTERSQRTERIIDSDAELLTAYQTLFGITLEQPPSVRRPVA